MAVKIRLARHGAKKRPYYRIVVADSRARRDGRFIEQVGRYDPIPDPHVIEVDLAKVDEWIGKGAQPTNAVSHLIDIARAGSEGKPKAEAPKPEPKIPEAYAVPEEKAAEVEEAMAAEVAEDVEDTEIAADLAEAARDDAPGAEAANAAADEA